MLRVTLSHRVAHTMADGTTSHLATTSCHWSSAAEAPLPRLVASASLGLASSTRSACESAWRAIYELASSERMIGSDDMIPCRRRLRHVHVQCFLSRSLSSNHYAAIAVSLVCVVFADKAFGPSRLAFVVDGQKEIDVACNVPNDWSLDVANAERKSCVPYCQLSFLSTSHRSEYY